MHHSNYADGLPTLELGLDSTRADDLRKLAALTGQKVPTRKDQLIAIIIRHLAGERLRTVWEGLDDLQRAAVAETVHSPSSQFEDSRFRAKYGQVPNWGSGKHSYDRIPTALCFFFHGNRVMPDDLRARRLTF